MAKFYSIPYFNPLLLFTHTKWDVLSFFISLTYRQIDLSESVIFIIKWNAKNNNFEASMEHQLLEISKGFFFIFCLFGLFDFFCFLLFLLSLFFAVVAQHLRFLSIVLTSSLPVKTFHIQLGLRNSFLKTQLLIYYWIPNFRLKRSNGRVSWSIIKLVSQSVGLQKVGYLSQTVQRVLGGHKDKHFGKNPGVKWFCRISSQLCFCGLK